MKKLLLFLLAFLAYTMATNSQALNTSVEINKISRPALMIDLPYSTTVIEGFLIDNLKKTGYDPETKGKFFWKQNKINGFYFFKGISLQGNDEKVDLYFKIEPKNKNIKDQSLVYLLVNKGGDHYITEDSDATIYNSAKQLLNSFIDKSASYKLEMDVKSQEEIVKNEMGKLNKLKQSEIDITKKIEQLQNDLKKNKISQENQKLIIENNQKKLDELKKGSPLIVNTMKG